VPILIGLGVNLYTWKQCLIQTILPLGSFAGIAREPPNSERKLDESRFAFTNHGRPKSIQSLM